MFEKIGNLQSYMQSLAMQRKAVENINNFNKKFGLPTEEEAEKKKIRMEVGAISARMKRGGKLSYSDLAYLQRNAPDLYSKAIQIEREAKAFALKLSRCKNKAEAQALKLNTVSNISCINQSGSLPSGVGASGTPGATGESGGEAGGAEVSISDGDFTAMRVNAVVREYYKIGEMRAAKHAEAVKNSLKPPKSRKKIWRA